MKKLFLLTAMVAVLSALACAETYRLYQGLGKMALSPKTHATYYHFKFYVENYPHKINANNSEGLEDRTGIQQCQGCDPTQADVLLYNTSNWPATGKIKFDAVSYFTSITKKGILIVTWTAVDDIHLFYHGDDFYCDPNLTWTVTGYFTPNPRGGWDFWKAKFVPAQ